MAYFKILKEEKVDIKDQVAKEESDIKKADDKEDKYEPIDLNLIDLASLTDKALIESDEFVYSPKSHPVGRILFVLLILAEILASKH